MKHESIVVVYDSCQAIAEEIADKLGAEIVSVQSHHQTYNQQNSFYVMNYIFIVALEFLLTFCGVAMLIRYYNRKA